MEQEQLIYYRKELSKYLNEESVPKELEWFEGHPSFIRRNEYFISSGVNYLIKSYNYGHFIDMAVVELDSVVRNKEYFSGCIVFSANNSLHTMYCRIIRYSGRSRALYSDFHYGYDDAISAFVYAAYSQGKVSLCLQSEIHFLTNS